MRRMEIPEKHILFILYLIFIRHICKVLTYVAIKIDFYLDMFYNYLFSMLYDLSQYRIAYSEHTLRELRICNLNIFHREVLHRVIYRIL